MHGTTVVKPPEHLDLPAIEGDHPKQSMLRWMYRGLTCAAHAVYQVLVREPLRLFYFQVMYDGKSPEDICAEDSAYPASFYTSSPENMAACQRRLDSLFKSWDVAMLTLVHFSLLAFVTIRLILCMTRCGRSKESKCGCKPCSHDKGTDRVITVDELKKLIEAVSAAKQHNSPVNRILTQ